MGLGANFGKYLKDHNIRVIDVARKSGINRYTIYSFIQRDSDRIDINTFIKLCDALGVKPEMFGESPKNEFSLNDEERQIIEAYRHLSNGQKELVKRMLGCNEISPKKDND